MDTTTHSLPPKGNSDIKHDILVCAEHLLHYNSLLINQCDCWLPAEMGNENMMKAIMERQKKEVRTASKNK